MCGLYGIISKLEFGFRDKKQFTELYKNLAIFSQVRGVDSTGFFYGNRGLENKPAGYLKHAVCASVFTESKDYKDHMDSIYAQGQYIIGHNRAATIGSVTTNNAHPFNIKTITGVHNGTLWGYHYLGYNYDTDSQCLLAGYEEKGVDIFKDISGAYALIMHDQKDGTITFCRNDERTLFYFENEDLIVFCSEQAILYAALARAGIDPSKGVLKDVTPMMLYKFSLKERKVLENPISIPKRFHYSPQPKATEVSEMVYFEVFEENKRGNQYEYLGVSVPDGEIVEFFRHDSKRLSYWEGVTYIGEVSQETPSIIRIKSSSIREAYPPVKQPTVIKSSKPTYNNGDEVEFVILNYHKTASAAGGKYSYRIHIPNTQVYGHFWVDEYSKEYDDRTAKFKGKIYNAVSKEYLILISDSITKVEEAVNESNVVLKNKKILTQDQFLNKAKHRCDSCRSDITLDMASQCILTGSNALYCPDCSDHYEKAFLIKE